MQIELYVRRLVSSEAARQPAARSLLQHQGGAAEASHAQRARCAGRQAERQFAVALCVSTRARLKLDAESRHSASAASVRWKGEYGTHP